MRAWIPALWPLGGALLLSGCAPRLYSDDAGEGDLWAPPENRWPSDAPPEGLEAQGMNEGQVAVDVRGDDQFGDEVSLWQFHGRWVLIDISTMWCAPCQDLARGAEDVAQAYADDPFTYLTVLHENDLNQPPTQEDLNLWARLPEGGEGPHDLITSPIVADPKGQSGSIRAVRANQYPVLLLVSPELRIEERIEPPTETRVLEVLRERLGAP